MCPPTVCSSYTGGSIMHTLMFQVEYLSFDMTDIPLCNLIF